MLGRLLMLLAAMMTTASCGKSGACQQYAEKEILCEGYQDDENGRVLESLKQQCLDAWNVPENPQEALTKCARKSPTCVDYTVCKARILEQ